MAVVTMKQLLGAGVHFGHQTRRWNPKMRRFILGERNGVYLIDLQQTMQGIEESYQYIRDLVAGGGTILFVGTKKQSQGPIAVYADACGMPYVNERWLGGMLTNFQTVSTRVKRMKEFEAMKKAGDFDAMPKKEALRNSRELEKLQRNLGGIRGLDKLPDPSQFDPTPEDERELPRDLIYRACAWSKRGSERREREREGKSEREDDCEGARNTTGGTRKGHARARARACACARA